MVDVVSAITPLAAVKTPAVVYRANAKNVAPSCSSFSLRGGDLLAGVLCNLLSSLKVAGREAAVTMNFRRGDSQPGRQLSSHSLNAKRSSNKVCLVSYACKLVA